MVPYDQSSTPSLTPSDADVVAHTMYSVAVSDCCVVVLSSYNNPILSVYIHTSSYEDALTSHRTYHAKTLASLTFSAIAPLPVPTYHALLYAYYSFSYDVLLSLHHVSYASICPIVSTLLSYVLRYFHTTGYLP
jgi:hypothetical protein